jgi:hypothetical protein
LVSGLCGSDQLGGISVEPLGCNGIGAPKTIAQGERDEGDQRHALAMDRRRNSSQPLGSNRFRRGRDLFVTQDHRCRRGLQLLDESPDCYFDAGLCRHYGKDNIAETMGAAAVSINLAFSQLMSDNKTETGQDLPYW